MPVPLREASVFAVDCQATGASPAHGSLLEIGWCVAHPRTSPQVETSLVALPEGASVPRVVERITGISDGDLCGAPAASAVWERALVAGADATLTVIHFARYELPFLRELHDRCEVDKTFPDPVVCTHQLATRLLPSLPRRGLRALAGYYGLGLEMERRSRCHAEATIHVWRHLVDELAGQGVHTVDDLHALLATPSPRRARTKVYPMPRAKRLGLPDAPGVYRMRRSNGELLYVGKAMSLKRRVNSYFQKQSKIADRTLEMLTQARDLDVTVTETAVEAALLETDEIKQQAPPYNVALVARDAGPYFCDQRLASVPPGGAVRFGPLRHVDDVVAVGVLADVVCGRRAVSELCELFAGRDDGPDEAMVSDGLVVFRDAFGAAVDCGTPRRARRSLLRLGAGLWRARLEAEAEAEAGAGAEAGTESETGTGTGTETETEGESGAETGAGGEGGGEDETEWVWDAERVAGALTALVRRGSRRLRRGRWIAAMTEAIVSWKPPDGDEERWRCLVIRGGEIAERLWIDSMATGGAHHRGETAPPCPTTCGTMDTYDRMRVLTTELRRLCQVTDDVSVSVGPRTAWTGAKLRSALQWV